MSLKTINALMLQEAFLSGAKSIENQKELINELNVFPVPDGDTGTNMTLTIMSAAKDVYQMENPGMKELAKTISSGSLRGARGNSGVILSQLLRGFTRVIGNYDELNEEIIADAFDRAVETAYKAVMKPKEGTILTVARGGSEKARELVGTTKDLNEFFEKILDRMQEVLDYTPELLPVLKEAGVVDSGGQGLLTVLQGAYQALIGNPIPFDGSGAKAEGGEKAEGDSKPEIKFGYCADFVIKLEKEFNEEDKLKFKAFLESIGDNVSLDKEAETCKVHVHTNDPGTAITKALKYGQLINTKIENLREECKECGSKSSSSENVKKEEVKHVTPMPHKKDGFVAVSIGKGLNEIFKGLGVDYIIEGGQTMNPSTEDVLKAIEAVNADNVYVLPNNKNIILAAEQAKSLAEDKNVIVIPSKTVPQGITALINYMYDNSAEDNETAMKEGLKAVKTGQITYAVRDTSIDDFDIKQNDIMGLDDKTIKAVGHNVSDVAAELINQMTTDGAELITLYYGEGTTEAEASSLKDRIASEHPDTEVEVLAGDQPIYYYIISVE